MNIQDIEIITYIVTGVVWTVSILRCFAYWRLASQVTESRHSTPPDGELPGLSVIVTTHNQADELKQTLPLILNQVYPNFEVIVVDMNSTDDTKDALERLEEEYHNLRHTYTPSTSRDISIQRLAITLGVKASCNPWIIITQANCSPLSHQWLRRIGDAILGHRSSQIVVGYTRYSKTSNYTERRLRFFHLWQQMQVLRSVAKLGAYRNDGTNLAYRKDLFVSHQGFASHSTLLVGATDIMVNQNSTKDNTTVCLHPEAILKQQLPSKKHWVQDRVFFQETRRHFTHKWKYRLQYAATVLLHIMILISMIATIALASWQMNFVAIAFTLLLWIIHFFLQGIGFNTAARALDDRGINFISVAWFMHLIPIWEVTSWLRYSITNKKQFRKKYI